MRSSRNDTPNVRTTSTTQLMQIMTQQSESLIKKQPSETVAILTSLKDTSEEENLGEVFSNPIRETEMRLIKQLDEGTFGIAYLAEWKSKNIVVKEFKLDYIEIHECENERKIMQMLSDLKAPNMVPILGYSYSSLHYSIAMPYMEKGSLANYMETHNPFAPPRTYRVLRDFLRGVEYLHRNDMVHGDLKDTNIFLDKNLRAYLGDFGTTRFVDGEICKYIHLLWRAPEALVKPYGTSTEMYSVAVLMWQLYKWELPFATEEDDDEVARFVNKGGRLRIDQDCPALLSKWIKRCWDQEPEKRMTATEVLGEVEASIKQVKNAEKEATPPSVASIRKWT